MREDWQKEDKLARLLDEIGCEQGAKIHVFVDFKIKADELTRYVGAFLPKCESDEFYRQSVNPIISDYYI